jgi:hypothetical protein
LSTLDDLVYITGSKLDGAVGRDRINVLNTAITSTSATTFNVTYTPIPDLDVGSVIEIDYEQMLVMAVSTNTLTVIRGWNNTTAVTHTASTPIYIEPRFPKQAIYNELVQEIRSLPRSLYKVNTVTIGFPANINQVDLAGATGEVYRILHAERKSFDGKDYPSFISNMRLIRNQDTSDFPSGYSLSLDHGRIHQRDVTIRVTYATSLITSGLSKTSNVQTDVGLMISAEDILTFGAASRLMYDKEALRLDFTRQGQSRNAVEVPPETYAKQAQRWRMEADRRISQESVRLLDLYGFMGV